MAVNSRLDESKVEPLIKDGVIAVTRAWLNQNVRDQSKAVEQFLNSELRGEAICPRMYYFNDTPEVREVLGL